MTIITTDSRFLQSSLRSFSMQIFAPPLLPYAPCVVILFGHAPLLPWLTLCALMLNVCVQERRVEEKKKKE